MQATTFTGEEPLSGCMYVPEPTSAKKRQPTSLCEACWLSLPMEAKGRFGQARMPSTTFPLSSNANAIAY